MTKQDTYRVLGIMQAYYRDAFRGMTDDALNMTVSLWQELFADEPVALVQAAVKAYASTDKKGFMPVPGQIKEQISILLDKGGLNEQEAWELVTNALRNSSYGSVEEFAKLPPDVQRAVGSPNMLRTWAAVNYEELQTVIASNFKRDYRAIAAQKKDFAKIPASVKQIATATNLLEGEHEQ